MAGLLLDSDICIDAMRPGGSVDLPAIRHTNRTAISVITYGEVLEGIQYSARRALDTATWRRFLQPIDILEVTIPSETCTATSAHADRGRRSAA